MPRSRSAQVFYAFTGAKRSEGAGLEALAVPGRVLPLAAS